MAKLSVPCAMGKCSGQMYNGTYKENIPTLRQNKCISWRLLSVAISVVAEGENLSAQSRHVYNWWRGGETIPNTATTLFESVQGQTTIYKPRTLPNGVKG